MVSFIISSMVQHGYYLIHLLPLMVMLVTSMVDQVKLVLLIIQVDQMVSAFDGQKANVRDGAMDPRSLAVEDEKSLLSTEDKLNVMITEENL